MPIEEQARTEAEHAERGELARVTLRTQDIVDAALRVDLRQRQLRRAIREYREVRQHAIESAT